MRRNDHLRSLLLLTLATGFVACGVEDPPEADLAAPGQDTPRSKDELGLALAKNLASHLGDPALRRYIRDKADERFDGDYDFLVQAARLDHLDASGGPRLDEILATDANAEAGDADELMDELAELHPLAQIALPQLNDPEMDWDPEHEIPLVVYVPSERTSDVLWAFDVDGNVHELSASEAPSELVIVVSENERTEVIEPWRATELLSPVDPQGIVEGWEEPCAVEAEPLLETDYFTYLHAGTLDGLARCGGGGGGGGGGWPPPGDNGGAGGGPCDRDNHNNKDKLYKMKFSSLNAFKGVNEWFDGGQDIEVVILFAQPNGAIGSVTKLIQGSDSDFKDCDLFSCWAVWKTTNLEVVTWDPAIYGNAMLYHWREKDPGNSINLGVSGSVYGVNISTNITITNGDDLLGQSMVEYCDNTDGSGTQYNTGSVQFEIRA